MAYDNSRSDSCKRIVTCTGGTPCSGRCSCFASVERLVETIGIIPCDGCRESSTGYCSICELIVVEIMLIVGVCGITGSAIIIIFGYIGNVIRNSRIFVSVIRRSCSPVAAEFAGLIPPRTKAVVECGKGRIVVNDTVLTDNAVLRQRCLCR